jgi:hypothetical protein
MTGTVVNFPVIPRINEHKSRTDVQQKTVRNMATNIQMAMSTLADRAAELSDIEAAEVVRQLKQFHTPALQLEVLVCTMTDGTTPPTGGKRA